MPSLRLPLPIQTARLPCSLTVSAAEPSTMVSAIQANMPTMSHRAGSRQRTERHSPSAIRMSTASSVTPPSTMAISHLVWVMRT